VVIVPPVAEKRPIIVAVSSLVAVEFPINDSAVTTTLTLLPTSAVVRV